MKTGILYLIPTPLSETEQAQLLPQDIARIKHLAYFVVEAEKTARKHLKQFQLDKSLRELSMSTLNEHTADSELSTLIQPLLNGEDVGLVSEAGCPAVADPGAKLVALAHTRGIRVVPLIGPSSILLALMASGANGQQFAFKGYLPADKTERLSSLKKLQEHILHSNETQIFIETPYRNDALLQDIIEHVHPQLNLCIAVDITAETESIISLPIMQWQKTTLPKLKKRPCIFVLFK